MMEPYHNPRTYRYLDSAEDRQQLIAEIRTMRAAVLRVAAGVPEAEAYTPRYHGWSLAAMLAHLHIADRFALLVIQAALLNIYPRIPMRWINQANGISAPRTQIRNLAVCKADIAHMEPRIAAFITRLPVERFSKPVYYPPIEAYTTVEKALQDYFVYHWQEHLTTMCAVEGIPQPPQARRLG
ncbi:MAG: DinB family protein [Armatimonadetes bacterium]|nr:DinB family protein [Anaerolineae bacterium]